MGLVKPAHGEEGKWKASVEPPLLPRSEAYCVCVCVTWHVPQELPGAAAWPERFPSLSKPQLSGLGPNAPGVGPKPEI